MAREFAGNFYKTKDWKNLRDLYAKSVGGICEICWQNGLVVPGEIVHHKIHLDEHNINDPNITLNMSNLQLVCRNCHANLHTDGKRYRVLEDGRHDFNMISYNDEEEYERNGYLHLFDMYLKVISHKSAKISCDFLYKLNPYEKCPMGFSKILTYEFKSTDNVSFGIFEGVLRRNMPDNDPEFLKSTENFYKVEYPQQMEELRKKLIEEKKNEFIKKHGKKPSKYDIENIERDVRHTINNGFEPPILVPGIYPEFNCVEVFEVGEKIEDKNLEDFISWMKSRDIFTVYHRLPNGTPVELRHLKFKDWKRLMNVK